MKVTSFLKQLFVSCIAITTVFVTHAVQANQSDIDYGALNLLSFTGSKQIELGEFDSLGRATSAHIQLQDKDEPTKKREPRIKYNPVGWHNYKLTYGTQGKKAYLFNRGHLIGYQFSGLTNEGRNLVQLTAYTNTGNYKGTDDSNSEGMLYYENRLDSWLANHPNYWLDYKVTPIYFGDELVPRQLILQYVGIDESGNLLSINLGSNKESTDGYGITTVILENYSQNATIDYLTGTAVQADTNTISSAVTTTRVTTETTTQGITSSETVVATQEQSTIVYVARNGSAEVYWYSKSNMPANTNFGNVVEMTEAEAISQGKRHSLRE